MDRLSNRSLRKALGLVWPAVAISAAVIIVPVVGLEARSAEIAQLDLSAASLPVRFSTVQSDAGPSPLTVDVAAGRAREQAYAKSSHLGGPGWRVLIAAGN